MNHRIAPLLSSALVLSLSFACAEKETDYVYIIVPSDGATLPSDAGTLRETGDAAAGGAGGSDHLQRAARREQAISTLLRMRLTTTASLTATASRMRAPLPMQQAIRNRMRASASTCRRCRPIATPRLSVADKMPQRVSWIKTTCRCPRAHASLERATERANQVRPPVPWERRVRAPRGKDSATDWAIAFNVCNPATACPAKSAMRHGGA
jgi:hypothetical protein